ARPELRRRPHAPHRVLHRRAEHRRRQRREGARAGRGGEEAQRARRPPRVREHLHDAEEVRPRGEGDGRRRARAAEIGEGALPPRQRAAQSEELEGLAARIRDGAVPRRRLHAGALPRRAARRAVRIELRARRRGAAEVPRVQTRRGRAGDGARVVLAGDDPGEAGEESGRAAELYERAEAHARVEGHQRSAQARLVSGAMDSTRPTIWSVRRELWENRAVYIAPLVVASVVLFGFVVSTIGMPG